MLSVKNLPPDLQKKFTRVQQLFRRELPRIAGHEAQEHFVDNFRRGGFVDNGLHKWPDVKRRDKSSPWYGFEYKGEKRTFYAFSRNKKSGKTHKAARQKRLNFSQAATTRTVLTSKRNYLMNSIRNRSGPGKATVFTTAPHAQIHNEGGEFKVFGKHTAQMPQRKFMGHSAELDKKIEQQISRQIESIFK